MTSHLLFPYDILDGSPNLVVSNPRLDGVRNGDLLRRDGVVELHAVEGPWYRARMHANVRLPEDRLKALAADHRVVCTLHCPSTNLRTGVVMEPDPGRPGSYSAEIELERTLLHKRARLEAVVAGTISGIEHRYLARSNSVDVRLEAVQGPEVSGDLDIRWRRFDQAHEGLAALDPALHDQLSWLELDRAEGPRLWLNDHVDWLRRLLDERGGRSKLERAVRDAVFDGIATSATLAMFNAAVAAAYELDQDSEEPWPGEWREAVLRTLLPLMYPDREPDDAIRQVMDSADPLGVQDVQARAHAAVARLLRTNVNAGRAIAALEEEQS